MKQVSYIANNRKGLLKPAFILAAVVLVGLIAYYVFYSEPCGNGTCNMQKGETCGICPADCGPCPDAGVCGDGLCTAGESHSECPSDCRRPAECGNAVCDYNENCATCSDDCACGAGEYCSPTLKSCQLRPCGDGKCDSGFGEDCISCPSDCGECSRKIECGDGRCDPKETFLSCPSDCMDLCGNGVCGPAENCWDCPQDCKCGEGEYCSAEQKECVKPVCGNQRCEIFENSANCCIDCPCEISYTRCNPDTKGCESPSMALGDEDVIRIVGDHYGKRSMQVERITPQEVYVWGAKTGRKTEVKIAGQTSLKWVLVTDAREVIELPLF